MFVSLYIALILATPSYPSATELKGISKMPDAAGLPSASAEGEIPPDILSSVRGLAENRETAGAYSRHLDRLSSLPEPTLRGAKEVSLYQKASPSVVLLMTKDNLGSGVLIAAGQILTNAHVVQGVDEIGVAFKPLVEGVDVAGSDVRIGKVVKRDEIADLALIEVREVPARIQPLQLGSVDTVTIGADVHAIGHPTGEAWTYTRGIVSQIRRNYNWTNEDNLKHQATVVQTQTPVSPGSSGGPLLDDMGRVIGINSFSSDGENINFAVSADDVRAFLARAGDRKSEPVPRQEKSATDECRPKLMNQKMASDKKGSERWFDLDCDGKVDAIYMIPFHPRDAAYAVIDTDGNGKADRFIYDYDRDGNTDRIFYDKDEDGNPEMVGRVRKGENEPYRYDRISR